MVITLKPGATKKNIKAILRKISQEFQPRKGINAYEYVGKISLKEDALDIQKALRNEWE